ncbi:hypothetical protein COLO4_26321 [Corchorus olitorius]|uniref:Uncharacterized protein n=1 Tax=Corchorus olitorius TaxID=93759 RepID=A0A1R3HXT8_9ROSI|nr:hypothetical protein COLO4_26321 [Corchorus olitorius]
MTMKGTGNDQIEHVDIAVDYLSRLGWAGTSLSNDTGLVKCKIFLCC